MSHDRSLGSFLRDYYSVAESEGAVGHSLRVKATDFDVYVDVVKFVWLNEGVTSALQFVRDVGFASWCHTTSRLTREALADELASKGERTLRSSGVKFREMAEFFASPQAVLRLESESKPTFKQVVKEYEEYFGDDQGECGQDCDCEPNSDTSFDAPGNGSVH
jgi:hypothetical protein